MSLPLLILSTGALLSLYACAVAQPSGSPVAPAVHHNMSQAPDGTLQVSVNGKTYLLRQPSAKYELDKMKGNPTGTQEGISFDFGDSAFQGELYYGFIPFGQATHPLPVYYRSTAKISNGKTSIRITGMGGRYDMVGWEKEGKGTIGYRVVDSSGQMVYDGKVAFIGKGPFQVDATILMGPSVHLVTHESATIAFETAIPIQASVEADGRTFTSQVPATRHEIELTALKPDTRYDYTVKAGSQSLTFHFRTQPKPGTRAPFVFAYASDSRNGNGGGERNLHGVNFYIMKKIMALATHKDAAFMQFTGDMINGYLTHRAEMDLQYINWKRSIEPFTHYMPMYVGMGNHESFMNVFEADGQSIAINAFPVETRSSEKIFADHFIMPVNGPESEDGAAYDPDPRRQDFPTYKENVFYYTHDNTAVVVLNSDYWYVPSTRYIPEVSGGLHGYIMDQQLKWLTSTIQILETDPNIDHIFISQHTPVFPNGGHVSDDMWYGGDNSFRPYVAGKPLDKGIIERRDQLLDLLVNRSVKVVAILTGDEHNYAKTRISPDMNIYPDGWDKPRLTLSRTIYQINNGAAGAPYYAQEQTPWTPNVSGFSTQHALVFFRVEGKKVSMEVINPDTLEPLDSLELRP